MLHYKAPCWGESIRLYYLVKIKGGKTENFYHAIEGFEYEWGYNYELVVEKLKIAKPKADGPSIGFRLKKQLRKEKVGADLQFELPLVHNGYRMIEPDKGNCLYLGVVPVNTGSVSCETLSAAESGVFQHSFTGEIRLIKLK